MKNDNGRQDDPGKQTVQVVRHATALARPTGEDSTVLAQASGNSAAVLIDVARAHDIPVLQDVALSTALGRLPPGSRIPEGVFLALGCALDFLLQQDDSLAEQAATAANGTA